MLALSYVFSVLSIIFYSIVYFPQFRLIYKTENSENLSILMLIMWTQGDALSLAGLILLHLELNLIIIGWYHLFIGISMMIYTFYYKKERKLLDAFYIMTFILLNITICSVLQIYVTEQQSQIGEIIGWITASLYIIGRFPQFYLNYKKKSVEGLSIVMYVNTILGNIFYVCSILTYSIEYEYIRINMPWIILSVVVIFLDLFIIAQCKYYIHANHIDMINKFIVDV